jgi:hypothetical protein
MSSFHKVKLEIRDQRALAAALGQMYDGAVESHDQAVELVNAWGKGHGVSTAEVVVRSAALIDKHGGYRRSDLGFKRQEDGTFALQVNDMDARTFDQKWLGQVKTKVGINKTIRLAKMQYGCSNPQIVEKTVNGKKQTVVTFSMS